MTILKGFAAPGVSLAVFDLLTLRPEGAAFDAEASPAERSRAARLRSDAHRERFALRRGALRRLLAAEVGVPPRALRFVEEAGQKPRIDGPGPHFSGSSSGSLFVVAISATGEVGVDVERILPRSDLDDVARLVFPPVVAARLRALDWAARVAAFYRAWTIGEAVVKVGGRGIADGAPIDDLPPDALVRDGRWSLGAAPEGHPTSVETAALGDDAVISLATAGCRRSRTSAVRPMWTSAGVR